MDFEQIQTFIDAAELGSFSQVAHKRFLTQPAVSKRVALLEQHLGTLLFDRIKRRVQLTPAGSAFLPHAKAIIDAAANAVDSLQLAQTDISGVISMGTSHHIGLHILPQLLKRFRERFDNVEFDIHFVDSELAYESILNGKLDLALGTLPPTSERHKRMQLNFACLWPDPLAITFSHEHALGKLNKLDCQQLAQYPALLPGANTFTYQIIAKQFNQLGLELNTAITTNYLETLKSMCVAGLGWSLLPLSMVDENLCAANIEKLTLERELGLITHKDKSLKPASREFIASIQDVH